MKIKFKSYIQDSLNFPPILAKNLIPSWFKTLPSTIQNLGTVKKCPPIVDFLTSGYYLRSSENYKFIRYVKDDEEFIDINGNITKNLNFENSSLTIKTLGYHTFDQIPLSINGIKKAVWKFNQWWSFSTPPGYSSLIISPFYYSSNFQIFPTLLDTDSGFEVPQGFAAMSTYNDREPREWEIKQGDVIAHIIPVKREDWESEFVSAGLSDQQVMIDKTLQKYKNHRAKKEFK